MDTITILPTGDAIAFNGAETAAARVLASMAPGAGPFAEPIPKAAFRLFTLAECAAAPPRRYLVKGLLSPGDLAVMFGPPGAGKSVVAPLLAHAIATGRSVFGRRVRQGPVLYVAAEDGTGMKTRAAALRAEHGDTDALRIIAEPVDLEGDGVDDPPDLALIVQAAERMGAVLIVLDTLARSFPGVDENDGRSMGRAVRTLRALCSPARAVLVVHHGAKAPQGRDATPRGHGILNGDADVTLRIDVPEDRAAPRTITIGKNRNGTALATMAFTIRGRELGTDEDGDPITAPVAIEADEEDMRASGADTKAQAEAKLSNAAALLLRDLRDLALDAELSKPEPGMPSVRAVKRIQLCEKLIRSGWFTEEEVRQTVSSAGYATSPVSRAAQTRMLKALEALKRKGFAGFSKEEAWPA